MVGTQDIFRWVVDTGACCGALLVLAYGVMLVVKQPARRVRVGELALMGCLLVGILQAVPATRFSLGVVEVGQPVRLPWFDDGGGVRGGGGGAAVGASDKVTRGQGDKVSWRAEVGYWLGYWREGLVGVYGLGVVVMGLRLGMAWVGLRRLARRGMEARGELAEVWEELTCGMGRRVGLRVSGEVGRPLTFGVRRPVVVIPAAVAEGDRADVRAVLRHELGHVERRDAWAWVLAGGVNVGLFFLPMLWWVKREMRLAQEFLADRAAVEAGGGAVEYAEMMVRLVGMTQGDKRVVRTELAMGAWGGWLAKSDLRVRVKHLFSVRGMLERRATRRWTLGAALCVMVVTAGLGAVTLADTSVKSQVRGAELRGVAFLLSRQEANGGWLTEMGPAPTALVVRSLLQAGVPAEHGAIVRARAYVAGCRRGDGGYYTDGEPTYQTAVVMSMYAALGDADARARVEAGREFLRRELERPVKSAGAWYQDGGKDGNGGIGGMGGNGPRGFADPGERAEDAVLETYGSLTYTRWKSLVYAGLQEKDPRVVQATRWLGEHWTLEKHPGTGSAEGLFYYYLAAARTLKAAGAEQVAGHDWRGELEKKLMAGQARDGSWVNAGSGRWLENRPEMVTAYALLALQEARR